jgi:hypothetical protein
MCILSCALPALGVLLDDEKHTSMRFYHCPLCVYYLLIIRLLFVYYLSAMSTIIHYLFIICVLFAHYLDDVIHYLSTISDFNAEKTSHDTYWAASRGLLALGTPVSFALGCKVLNLACIVFSAFMLWKATCATFAAG